MHERLTSGLQTCPLFLLVNRSISSCCRFDPSNKAVSTQPIFVSVPLQDSRCKKAILYRTSLLYAAAAAAYKIERHLTKKLPFILSDNFSNMPFLSNNEISNLSRTAFYFKIYFKVFLFIRRLQIFIIERDEIIESMLNSINEIYI